MPDNSSNNKRIAKNTLLLYARSIVVMLITLYSSRVILDSLGIEDYGLYNVVGGVVALFAFLRTSLTKSTQRFLNVEMVKNDGRMRDTFKVSMTIHILIALFAFILAETLGLWFLNKYIQIPDGRELAANVLYQSTVISLIVTIVIVPYTACVIAHESMGVFAIVSIVDACLKLAICFIITLGNHDRLVFYGWLLMGVQGLNFIIYFLFCKIKFEEARFGVLFDKPLLKEMFGYTTWTVLGQSAIVGVNQGNNILMNMFFSVSANAAMGVASQVNSAVATLTSNFQTAFNPQITKSYASKDFEYLKFLVNSTSKISFFLLLIVCLPLIFNIEWILDLWLHEVPESTGIFCSLMLSNAIVNALSAPLNFTVLSSGKIKWFQIVTALAYLLDLILVYLFFRIGFPAFTALVIKVAVMVLILFIRLYFASRLVDCINLHSFLTGVLAPIAVVSVICVFLGFAIFSVISKSPYLRVPCILLHVICSCCVTYLFGLNKEEKKQVMKILKIKQTS